MSSSVSTQVNEEPFGTIATPNGNQSVAKFTLTNENGVRVQLISFGATLTNLIVPDKNGRLGDVVLGFDDLDGYSGVSARNPYFGAIVGRVANRIAKGRFHLDGVEYQLASNDGDNHLHGGNVGFDKVVWQPYVHPDGRVTFSHLSPHLDEGYPGNLLTQITYALTDSNEVVVDFVAMTDRPTPVNLANHAYFNLAGHDGGSQQLYEHRLEFYANHYTPVDSGRIPTGQVADVTGTAFDLRSDIRLGDVIRRIPGGGFDHNFVASGSDTKFNNTLPLIAKLWHPESGRLMRVFSDQPAFQFYTGNALPSDGSLVGKNATVYSIHDALCIETQNFPNAINQPNFPDSVLRPGAVYHHTTVLAFGIQ